VEPRDPRGQRLSAAPDNRGGFFAARRLFFVRQSGILRVVSEPSTQPNQAPVLKVSNLFKTYGRLPVLSGVSLTVEEGKRYGIVGANGSGKSTLVRILSGLEQADTGVVEIDGKQFRFVGSFWKEVWRELWSGRVSSPDAIVRLWHECRSLRSPRDWLERGVAVVMQRPTKLLPRDAGFSAEARLGAERTTPERGSPFRAPYLEAMRRVRKAGNSKEGLYLSRFARALRWQPKLLVLDELTTRLSQENREWVLSTLKELAGRPASLASVLISHDFAEVVGHADPGYRYYFKRGTLRLSNANAADGLRAECFGEPKTPRVFANSPQPKERLTLRRVSPLGGVDLIVKSHEVKAVWHDTWQSNPRLRQDFLRLLQGENETAGQIGGLTVSPVDASGNSHESTWSPKTMADLGVQLLPPDIRDAAFAELSLAENLLYRPPWADLPGHERTLRLHRDWATNRAMTIVKRAGISAPGVWQPLNWLSGGNQQKALLFAALERGPCVLIAVSPFASLDEPARSRCLAVLREEAARGLSVLLVVQSKAEADFVEGRATC
jgi:ABC-type multidrug transport system ATPase subunit